MRRTMMRKLKPIETVWDGHRFRSRLEARWAVFFDAAGIKYEYEPEGFELPSGRYYLPDFYLPEIDWWVEVKGRMTPEDESRIDEFRDCGYDLLVVNTLPAPNCDDDDPFWFERDDDICNARNFDAGDFPYLFCVCPACGKIGISFDGRGWRVCEHRLDGISLKDHTWTDESGAVRPMRYPEYAGHRCDDKGYSSDAPVLCEAYTKARQARFEHGEAPRPCRRRTL
jgi:hypothetical protein